MPVSSPVDTSASFVSSLKRSLPLEYTTLSLPLQYLDATLLYLALKLDNIAKERAIDMAWARIESRSLKSANGSIRSRKEFDEDFDKNYAQRLAKQAALSTGKQIDEDQGRVAK
ncbi:hypothetical protein B0H11DRAFT_2204202 [Mycena galericulata]|nr:hypothetical protein B0H11DRAFT_2204202 [Mycena galericulata]